ncbi:MAG: alpha/beta hydrolase [Chloroflexota bacterium]
MPTLVVLGARDLVFYNHPIADLLVSRIPNARKLVIPGVGHLSNMENPQTFNGEVLRFLDEL